jgi:RHS repeat-associated protein
MWSWYSDPFGTDLPNENPAAGGTFKYNLRFPGQLYDSQAGLSQNYFRDYDSAIGRYVENDPIGLPGGLNTYAYVGGSPIRYFDPYGLTCTSNYDFFWDRWFQRGKAARSYGAGSPESQEMQQSSGADYMRQQFKVGGCKSISRQGYGTIRAYFETFTSPCSTEFQVGGFVWSATNVGSCKVRYHIQNQASLYSFFLHAPGVPHADRSTVSHGGNIDQTFDWTEKSPCSDCCQ